MDKKLHITLDYDAIFYQVLADKFADGNVELIKKVLAQLLKK